MSGRDFRIHGVGRCRYLMSLSVRACWRPPLPAWAMPVSVQPPLPRPKITRGPQQRGPRSDSGRRGAGWTYRLRVWRAEAARGRGADSGVRREGVPLPGDWRAALAGCARRRLCTGAARDTLKGT